MTSFFQEATAQYFAAQSVIEKLRDESSKYKGQLKLREMELHSSNMELKEEKETLEILRVQVAEAFYLSFCTRRFYANYISYT